MTPFEQLISNHSLTDAFGWAIIHSFWQITLIALLCGVALGVLRKHRANVRYNAALAFMAAAFVIFAATFIWLYEPSQPAMTWASAKDAHFTLTQQLFTHAPLQSWEDCRTVADYYFFVMNWLGSQLPVIVAVWCIGAAVFSIRLGIGLLQTHRLRTTGIRPVSEEWGAVLQQMADRMQLKIPVRMAESVMVRVPMVIGWLRPVVLFPVGLLTALPPQEIEGILAHELAHIRRHDFMVHICQSVVEVVLFYHPAIWWLSAQINHERENCCDDLAIAATGNTLAYIKALANLADLAAQPATPAYAMAASGKPKSGLLQRIMRIAQPNRSNEWALQSFPIRFAVALTLFCSLALFTSATEATELAAEVTTQAQKIVHRAEVKLSNLFNLQTEDTTKKERQKLTVIKKDGDRHDTVVIEADEMVVNFGNRATAFIQGNAWHSNPDSVFRYNLKTINQQIDSLMRRFYVRTDSSSFQWNYKEFSAPMYDSRSGRWLVIPAPPEIRVRIDTHQVIGKRLRIIPSDSLTLRSSSFFFDVAEPSEKELLLLEKTMEALEKNQRLSKKQLKETREALQKTLKEARENRKQQLQNVRSQVYVNQPKAFTDEFAKLDSIFRKRNEWLMEVQLENVENAVKVLENITIIRPDGITSVRRFPEDADYFIDGKAATKADVDKIAPSTIKSVEIEKKDGKRSIIRITTR
ncbi:M56 family metallopeptidase [Rhodoflexus caldus]|uniref:M56 family metallopeptidase n=1 Tax=Rhodoflexus caldus TaxID=2891236 RepID=UPI002029B8A7|nr:M56 family metallopeptidase [Rhodoflexus caldus]